MLIHVYFVLLLLALFFLRDLKAALRDQSLKVLVVLWFYIVCVDISIFAGYAEKYSILYFSASVALSIFVPLSFFFLRKCYTGIALTRRDKIHLVPLTISLTGLILFSATDVRYADTSYLFYSLLNYTVVLVYMAMLVLMFRSLFDISALFRNTPGWISGIVPNAPTYPKIINGIPESANNHLTAVERPQQMSFTIEQIADISARIEVSMTTNKSFLQQGFSIADLADQTGIHLHQLSAFINNHYKMHYNDFINRYRVDYCKKKIIDEGEWKHLTLQAIAEASGFGNRNTFTAAFKKTNGMTPADFLKQIKSKQSHAA